MNSENISLRDEYVMAIVKWWIMMMKAMNTYHDDGSNRISGILFLLWVFIAQRIKTVV